MLIEEQTHHAGPYWYQTLLKYYPVKFPVSQQYAQNRQVVYSFKDGIRTEALNNVFLQYLQRLKVCNSGRNFHFCTIPASTIERTTQRYQQFCHMISSGAGIENGYSLLTPNQNRNQVHIGQERNYANVISSITFGDVAGRHIILCDDVATTGKSFLLIANKLKSLGATSVCGLMLAKTHWLEEGTY